MPVYKDRIVNIGSLELHDNFSKEALLLAVEYPYDTPSNGYWK